MKTKKLIFGILGVLVVVVVVAVLVVALKLDSIVKAGIETVGPQLTKTTVVLDKVTIRPFSGSGAIQGLEIGSPQGYKAEYTMKLGDAKLAIQPGSLMSDKVVIDDIDVEGPEIILEGGLKDNNLTALQKNVNDSVGGTTGQPAKPAEPAPAPAGAQKKLQVNHFKLAGAKVHLRLAMLGDQNLTITAPDIEMSDLGTGPDGITVAELVQRSLDKLTAEVLTAAAGKITDLGKNVTDMAGKAASDAAAAATKESGDAVNKATEGLKNLFKK
ncbi:hypothetical protein GC207_13175 [bacterium]|nr:hypothetical protein [bacterium]